MMRIVWSFNQGINEMSYKYHSIFLEANNWDDILSHCNNQSTTQGKGDLFEELTELFLRLHPSYATKLSNVWRLRDLPEDIRIYLNLPIRDEGIDLIAQTIENEYWSVQCKYLTDIDHSIDRKYLSTFTDLSFGIAKNISFGLVATTADRFSHKLSMYEGRLGFMAGDIWRGLDSEFFELVHQYLTKDVIKITKKEPRPHQVRAIERAKDYFSNDMNTRGKLIMPCGTGKSLTGFWIGETLEAHNILVTLPSLSLIRQTLEVWTREAVASNMAMRWIVVCSDDTVGENDNDDIAVLTQDLGILIDTNQEKISRWLNQPFEGKTFVFSTYQSGKITASAAKNSNVNFDLGIFDEAHKTVGKKGALFSHLLYDENISIQRRIFMTATERRYRGRSDEIASMDDPKIYGHDFEVLSFKEALEANPPILSDYKIITVIITRAEIAAMIKNKIIVADKNNKWSDEMEAEMLAAVIALRKAMQIYPIHHAVSFHSSIKRSKLFQQAQENFNTQFIDYDKIETFHVSGKTPTAVRARSIQKFAKSDKALITNARCLTEGVDVPGIDAVLFADPRKSTVDIVQAVGRALRISEGKLHGYVIVPVITECDTLNSLEDMNNYQSIIDVLRALAANDERIIEYFKEMSSGESNVNKNDLCSFEFSQSSSIDIAEFARALELKVWDKLGKLSWRSFQDARDFARSLNLKSRQDWLDYAQSNKRPQDIPTNPNMVYSKYGWDGIADWLGYSNRNDTFEVAREYVRSLGLKDRSAWLSFAKSNKKPQTIPLNPQIVYAKSGWNGLADWLGSSEVRTAKRFEEYATFEEAKKFVQELGLISAQQWKEYCKGNMTNLPIKPENIPTQPEQKYRRSGWISMNDFLGVNFSKKWRTFDDARTFIKNLQLKDVEEWKLYRKGDLPEKGILPLNIPKDPELRYQNNGWISLTHWIGLTDDERRYGEYKPFEEAREFIQSLNLKGQIEWRSYCQDKMPHLPARPLDIPTDPARIYAEQWKGFGDWVGTGRIREFGNNPEQWRSYEDAKTFIHTLELKSYQDWTNYLAGKLTNKIDLPSDIPRSPLYVYKNKGWKSMADWLGAGNAKKRAKPSDYETAASFSRLLGLKNYSEWATYCKGNLPDLPEKPNYVPASPYLYYSKNAEWISWEDWLGN